MIANTSTISDLSLFVPLKTHSQPTLVSDYAMSPPLRGCPYCRVFPDDHAEESALAVERKSYRKYFWNFHAGSIYNVQYSTRKSLMCSVVIGGHLI